MEAINNIKEKITGQGDEQRAGVTNSAAVRPSSLPLLRRPLTDSLLALPQALESSPNLAISQSNLRLTESSVSRMTWRESQRELLSRKDTITSIPTSPLARLVLIFLPFWCFSY
jgi:hypothetical protein